MKTAEGEQFFTQLGGTQSLDILADTFREATDAIKDTAALKHTSITLFGGYFDAWVRNPSPDLNQARKLLGFESLTDVFFADEPQEGKQLLDHLLTTYIRLHPEQPFKTPQALTQHFFDLVSHQVDAERIARAPTSFRLTEAKAFSRIARQYGLTERYKPLVLSEERTKGAFCILGYLRKS